MSVAKGLFEHRAFPGPRIFQAIIITFAGAIPSVCMMIRCNRVNVMD